MPTDVPGDVAGLDDTLSVPPDSRPREPDPESTRRIGPYRLLHLIGEGGMGEVWVAEQLEPVRRKVALKVIKAGMDTKQVVARFEAERQALALMDHPAIAKVLDGGSTPEGRPYFVMEYVPGVSLTEHCDTHRLPTDERLKLFIEVCEGVQHAHQKAVIHRDLKPSNILVSLVDGRAQPKIIDFGIAKATGQRLTEKTLFTEVGSVIGTPEYMSPEQADLTGQDIDTRTDVYSLGVILYQLLTGELPFGSADLRSSSYEELRRKLREVDPPRPSTRLATLGDRATEAARKRETDPGSLRRQLEGDLDAITMKALEKDRSRRYGTAAELAEDVQRSLRSEPVNAKPATRAYRFRKYLRRHRVGVTAAGLIALTLVGALVAVAFQARRIAIERDRARLERDRANLERDRADREARTSKQVTDFVTKMFMGWSPSERRGRPVTVNEVVGRASKEVLSSLEKEPLVQAKLLETLSSVSYGVGLEAEAKEFLERTVAIRESKLGAEHPDTLRARSAYFLALTRTGRFDPEAIERSVREIMLAQQRVLGTDHPDALRSMSLLGNILRGEGRYADAEALQRELLLKQQRVLGPEDSWTLWTEESLAMTLGMEWRLREAEELQRHALETQRRVLGSDHPETIRSMELLGKILLTSGRLEEAEALERESITHAKQVFGTSGGTSATGTLATILMRKHQFAEAIKLQREVLDAWDRGRGPNNYSSIWALSDLGMILDASGRSAEAERAQREALMRLEKTGSEKRVEAQLNGRLASVLATRGRYTEAVFFERKEIELDERFLGPAERKTMTARYNLACFLARLGRKEDALSTLEEAAKHGIPADVIADMAGDADLKPLRNEPRFKALLQTTVGGTK